jgi:hypothetical protein
VAYDFSTGEKIMNAKSLMDISVAKTAEIMKIQGKKHE